MGRKIFCRYARLSRRDRICGKYCVPDGTLGDAYANDFSTNILSLAGYNLNEHFLDHCRIFDSSPEGMQEKWHQPFSMIKRRRLPAHAQVVGLVVR